MRGSCRLISLLLTILMPSFLPAQQAVTASSMIVPRLVNFAGRATDAQGRAITGVAGITFAIYKDQSDGPPLWMETQNVQAGAGGHYIAQMGAGKAEGLPLELFTSGEARWLGVRVNDGEEQPRVLLLSVPYALKAADAQTLGGLPPSAFMRAPESSGSAETPAASTTLSLSVSSEQPTKPDLGGSGTKNYVPLWTDNSGTLGNSVFSQVGTGATARIGLNLINPLATLDVNGTTLIRGTLEPVTKGYATATKGFNSNPLDFEASSFSSTTQKAVMQHFEWQAEPTANNTASPGATLNLLFGQDDIKPAETGLKLSKTGVFTFVSGQTFPGMGTVTNVGLSAPASDFIVSGSPITKNGTLGLDWNVAPTAANAANAIVKRDASGSFNSGAIVATSSGLGLYGISSASQAVWGETFATDYSNGSGPDGVHGVTHSNLGSGVGGLNWADGGVGVWGEAPTGIGFYTPNNVQQERSAGGWLKAMAYIDPNTLPGILRCFNSTLRGFAATRPPCGFNVTLFGSYTPVGLDFGFEVDDRFLMTQASDVNIPVFVTVCTSQEFNCRFANYQPNQNQALIFRYNGDQGIATPFYIFVF